MLDKSTATARAVVQKLLASGVEHAVLAPGSRSAPLAIALLQAENAGLIKVHVRIDERDAGFLALGLAKVTKNLVPVLVTSGSAVANLLPAIVEAFQSGIPIVVLSADRPISARGKSAPQTIDQSNIFGSYVKANYDTSSADFSESRFQEILDLAQAVHNGPVQLNLQFELPLVPSGDNLEWTPSAVVKAKPAAPVVQREQIQLPSRGLIIAGDISDSGAVAQVAGLSEQLGWPIIHEPSANLHASKNAIAHGVLLVASGQLPKPDCIITVGTVGLSRPILHLLGQVPEHIAIHLAGNGPDTPDPVQTVSRVLAAIPSADNTVDSGWLATWQKADSLAHQIIANQLSAQTLTGPAAASRIWHVAEDQDQLMVAASWPVRHIESYAKARSGLRVFGNRGANGIDGLISTAWGLALGGSGRTYLLIGDVAFLHNIGALAVPMGSDEPNLTIVVLDNDGGGIFSQLEQGGSDYSRYFEKAFATPHGKDLWQIAESFGFASSRVTTQLELDGAITRTKNIPGVHIIVCLTGNRNLENYLITKIQAEITAALATSA
ncbi:MAG: 2-succinyl-5-enolpyruvyl-6-hydroxy-3-cyclohexene-1-carboxylic-acid synthase [Actinobacteria bacterium]|nr:2-succinyl-5-enolpyruvyl-6-hydroxy-3-cyclohexene-1-carboxylic-acid synthase [Actinomycetota bacterium]